MRCATALNSVEFRLWLLKTGARDRSFLRTLPRGSRWQRSKTAEAKMLRRGCGATQKLRGIKADPSRERIRPNGRRAANNPFTSVLPRLRHRRISASSEHEGYRVVHSLCRVQRCDTVQGNAALWQWRMLLDGNCSFN